MCARAILSSPQGNVAPLLVAVNLGHREIANLLVDHGANPYQEYEVCPKHKLCRILLYITHNVYNDPQRGVLAFEMAELRNFADLARKLNPQQVL